MIMVCSWRRRAVGRGRSLHVWMLVVTIAVLALSCRSSTGPDPAAALTVDLDAVPTLLKSDSLSSSVIWATVLEHGRPAPDSTRVSFVATMGTVEADALTHDGLARVVFRPGRETGVAVVVAQVRAVRDTVMLTIY